MSTGERVTDLVTGPMEGAARGMSAPGMVGAVSGGTVGGTAGAISGGIYGAIASVIPAAGTAAVGAVGGLLLHGLFGIGATVGIAAGVGALAAGGTVLALGVVAGALGVGLAGAALGAVAPAAAGGAIGMVAGVFKGIKNFFSGRDSSVSANEQQLASMREQAMEEQARTEAFLRQRQQERAVAINSVANPDAADNNVAKLQQSKQQTVSVSLPTM